ncbi:uncharacterized protein [Petaurus breviceps papuanus]|uniref:uncharacterized protein n=1 Tax=Petaurus breviceps papuanus TaxID=3040969 RepID=UPI0036D84C90
MGKNCPGLLVVSVTGENIPNDEIPERPRGQPPCSPRGQLLRDCPRPWAVPLRRAVYCSPELGFNSELRRCSPQPGPPGSPSAPAVPGKPPPPPSHPAPVPELSRGATSLPQSVSERRPKSPDSSLVPERAEAPPQAPAPSFLPASPSSSEKARSLPSSRPAGLLEAAAAPCWMLSSLSEENPPASPESRCPEGRRFPRGGGERPPAAGP